jgi:transcriptional regulator with XRE-family HTH domain
MEPRGAAPTEIGQTVGQQIKRLRQARRMSVSELSRQTGISKATLSVLESGQGNPTIETIAAIAVGLRLPLGDLITPPPPNGPIVRKGTEPPTESKQELLHRSSAGTATEMWRLRIGRRGRRIESPAHTTGTVEHILVTRGPIIIGAAIDPVQLDQGDFVSFPADVPHLYEACADDVEAVIVMNYPTIV